MQLNKVADKVNAPVLKAPDKRDAAGRIVQVFLNADLRSGHIGLTKLARENKITTADLEPGQYVVFINSKKDKIKIYAANQVVAYHRSLSGRIEMATISHIPEAFRGEGFSMDTALKAALEDILGRKRDKKDNN